MSAVHFSSAFMSWRTPRKIFDELHDEFQFTVDGCATDANSLLDKHWTEYDEPLLRSWAGERVFINPPYGRQLPRWMEKAWTESPDALVVALIPSRTDTAWWHDYVMPASEIRFIRGRLKFEGHDPAWSAPFPSCVVVWNPEADREDEDALGEAAWRRASLPINLAAVGASTPAPVEGVIRSCPSLSASSPGYTSGQG